MPALAESGFSISRKVTDETVQALSASCQCNCIRLRLDRHCVIDFVIASTAEYYFKGVREQAMEGGFTAYLDRLQFSRPVSKERQTK